jgi:TRAP-type mannitol/chloroaromatic compound transport system permease small subunit
VQWPGKLILLVGFLLLAIQGISEIIKKIAVMRGDIPDPNPPLSLEEIAEQEVAMAEARND